MQKKFYNKENDRQKNSEQKQKQLSLNPILSQNEYDSLRTEIVARMDKIHSQAQTALVTIISAWVAGLTFESTLLSDSGGMWIYKSLFMNLLRALFFVIPILFYIPLSVKSGENITQTMSIASYIKVFYEYTSNRDKRFLNWEISNCMMSNISVDRKKKNWTMRIYNAEYLILSIISFFTYGLFGFLDIHNIRMLACNGIICMRYKWLFIGAYILFAIISLVAIGIIYVTSSMKKNGMDKVQYYIEGYLNRALEVGVISESEMQDAIYQLNPYNEINKKYKIPPQKE